VRNVLRRCFVNLIFPLLFFPIIILGCTRSVLQTYPASNVEYETVSRAFTYFQDINETICGCCIDAEVDIALSVSGWFNHHTAKLSGYIQAMRPGYIRFVAINPLGQPLYILVTDGKLFTGLNVFEENAYSGSTLSETYNKFAPEGFEPGFSYYWLSGRLQPGEMKIRGVMHDREQNGFWLQIFHAKEDTESMVLFDPEQKVILRHVLRDERGRYLLDVGYTDYQTVNSRTGKAAVNDQTTVLASPAAEKICRVPGRITVSSRAGSEKIEVGLYSFIEDPHFSEEDFSLDIPDNFVQMPVR
jgi:hypothetical protein